MSLFSILRRIAVGALLAATCPTLAASPSGDTPQLEAVEALAERASALAGRGQFEPALALIDDGLAARTAPGRERGGLLYMRAMLLSDLNRGADAVAAMDQAAAMLPDRPQLRLVQAQVQLRAGRPVEASRSIVYLADAFPGGVAKLDQPWLSTLLRELAGPANEPARFDLLMALKSRGYAGRDAPGAGDWLYDDAVLGLIARDRLDEAKAMAASFVDSGVLIQMLVDRRYAPLWPAIERQAGADGAKAIAAEVTAVEQAYRAKPADNQRLTAYLSALRGAGRAADAVAIAAPAVADMAKIEAAGDDAFWIVNDYAYALAATGRIDAADAALGRLLALDLAKHPGLVSMAINRATLNNSHGRAAEALAAADWVAANGAAAASDYGRMWIAAARTCALASLGDAKVAAALTALTATPKANYAAATMALVCADRLDDAEKLVVARLDDPAARSGMLLALQDYRPDPAASARFRETLIARLMAIRDRPAVRKAIARYGRVLPIAASQSVWGAF